MLTNIGILASGKGMVLVPNLSGLSKTAAATAITNAGLIPIDGGSTNTENSALNNTIASQLPNAGELVPYESQVTYIWFNFVAAPPFFPPFFPFFPFFPYFPGPTCTPGQIVSEGECLFDGGVGGYFKLVTRYINSECDTETEYEVCSPPPPDTTPFFPPFFPFFPFFPPYFVPPFFPEGCQNPCPAPSSGCQDGGALCFE
jgi:hypothetical protein